MRRADDTDLQSVRTGSDFWAGGGHDTESSSMFTADVLNFGSASGSGSSSTPGRRPPADEEIAKYQRNGPSKKQDRSKKNGKRAAFRDDEGSSSDSDGTQIAGHGGGVRPVLDPPRRPPPSNEVVDEVGAQDAFVAGMMWALSRRLLPGEPYTPSAVGSDAAVAGAEGDTQRGRWRLEECLRYVNFSVCSVSRPLYNPC